MPSMMAPARPPSSETQAGRAGPGSASARRPGAGRHPVGPSRREFLKRGSGLTAFGALTSLGAASLAFVWPNVRGGFGATFDVGSEAEVLANIEANANRWEFPQGRTLFVRYDPNLDPGGQYADLTGGAMVMALYWKCVHLGCKVPWCWRGLGGATESVVPCGLTATDVAAGAVGGGVGVPGAWSREACESQTRAPRRRRPPQRRADRERYGRRSQCSRASKDEVTRPRRGAGNDADLGRTGSGLHVGRLSAVGGVSCGTRYQSGAICRRKRARCGDGADVRRPWPFRAPLRDRRRAAEPGGACTGGRGSWIRRSGGRRCWSLRVRRQHRAPHPLGTHRPGSGSLSKRLTVTSVRPHRDIRIWRRRRLRSGP